MPTEETKTQSTTVTKSETQPQPQPAPETDRGFSGTAERDQAKAPAASSGLATRENAKGGKATMTIGAGVASVDVGTDVSQETVTRFMALGGTTREGSGVWSFRAGHRQKLLDELKALGVNVEIKGQPTSPDAEEGDEQDAEKA